MHQIVRIQKNEHSIYIGLRSEEKPLTIAKVEPEHPNFGLLMLSQIGDFLKVPDVFQTPAVSVSLSHDMLIENVSLKEENPVLGKSPLSIKESVDKGREKQKSALSDIIDEEQQQRLVVGLKTMSLVEIKKMHKELGLSMDASDAQGNALVHLSAQYGRPDVVAFALTEKNNLTTVNSEGHSVGLLLAKTSNHTSSVYIKKQKQYNDARDLLLRRYALMDPNWREQKNASGLLYHTIATDAHAKDLLNQGTSLRKLIGTKNRAASYWFDIERWSTQDQQNFITIAKDNMDACLDILEEQNAGSAFFERPMNANMLDGWESIQYGCVLAFLGRHITQEVQMKRLMDTVNCMDVLHRYALHLADTSVNEKKTVQDGFNVMWSAVALEALLERYGDDRRVLLMHSNGDRFATYKKAADAPFSHASYDINWDFDESEKKGEKGVSRQAPFGVWGAWLLGKTSFALPLISDDIGYGSIAHLIKKGAGFESEKKAKEFLKDNMGGESYWEEEGRKDKLLLNSALMEKVMPTLKELKDPNTVWQMKKTASLRL